MANRDDFDAHPFAAPESDLTNDSVRGKSGQMVYAGFWQRFAASFVDGIVTQILAMGLGAVAGAILGASGGKDYAGGVGGMIGLMTGWLYSALQESSASRATLGKKLLGLQVVDLSGEQISFGRATGRYFGKIVSSLILLIGYLMQPFTEKKQALHDIMAGTLVIKV